MTTPFTEDTILDVVRADPRLSDLLGDDSLTATQIVEGNVNLIFRVANTRDPQRSVLIKQALPHSWRYPDFKMPVERQQIEHDVLQIEARYCPDQVPAIYLYDAERHLLALQDLNDHLVMRDGLMQQRRYPLVAQHIGTFMARTLFYTSDLYLPSGEKKALVARFLNPVLRKVQEDLVFTQPFQPHPNNRWTPPLEPLVQSVYGDDRLRAEIFALKERYMTHAQALLHNDLHSGSILLTEDDTKVIDPEFAFVGPIGHDIGSYLGNLVISYAAQEHHAPDPQGRASYRAWLVDLIRNTWQVFEAEWGRLWETEGNDEWPSPSYRQRYMQQLLHDAAGFGAAEIYRRTIGMAHVQDFWTIEDQHTRAAAERVALNVACTWLLDRANYGTIDDLLGAVTAATARAEQT
jgi:5-methylthioribose kinase